MLLSCIMLAGLVSVPALAADKPVLTNLTVYVAKDTPKVIDFTKALADNSPAATSYSLTTSPSHGTAVRNDPAVQGVYKYTPSSGYTGPDTIQFTASNAGGASNTATVAITVVNAGPIARSSTIKAVKGKPVKGVVDAVEPSDYKLSFEIKTEPTKGAVSKPTSTADASAGNPVGSFTYTADENATGTDSFTYMAINEKGAESGIATVTVQFVAGNPSAENLTLSVIKNTPKAGQVKASDPVYPMSALTFNVVLSPLNGSLKLTGVPDGDAYTAWTPADFTNAGSFYYVPKKDYVGTDSFTFEAVNPDTLRSEVATVSITVGATKPSVEDIEIKVTRNGSVSAKLKGHDPVDETGASLDYSVDVKPKRGTISRFNSSTGEFTYSPKKDRLGTDTFQYSVSNGTEKSELATVSVKIIPEEYSPIEYADMKASGTSDGHWAHEAVGILGAMNMIKGEEIQKLMYFRPEEPMNRADFVLFLNAVMEIAPDKGATASAFDDVTESWMIPPLNAAKSAGVTAGSVIDGKNYFRPESTLSRIEAVVFISNVLKLPDTDTALSYTDAASVPGWAVQHLKNMSAYEILSGYTDGTFRPTVTIKRCDAAMMLLKTYREKLLQMSRAADKADGTPDWTGDRVLFSVK